jgi:hypothetical protein
MATVIERREFANHHRFTIPEGLDDIELRRCTFRQCQAPAQTTLDQRPTLRHITMTRCHVEASDLGPIVAEDCLVDTIWFHRGIWGPQRLGGCAFKHVVLRGSIHGALEIDYSPDWIGIGRYALDDAFVMSNADYYEKVDWALDISEARFTNCWLKFADIPARLVRRDPATQIVVRRERALGRDWMETQLPEGAWRFSISDFLKTELPDLILVACPKGDHYQRELDTIKWLRDEGIAEAD